MPAEGGFPWHRAFHPLCGADPLTLASLVARRGAPSLRGAPTLAVAALMSLMRAPFTLAEAALDAGLGDPAQPPVFVVGHPRSGTTHLHNVLAASGAFGLVPPVIATLPWERRSIGPLMRPLVEPRLPATRLIDGVAMHGEDPTEDEIGLANMGPLSYFHALYFPSRFAEDWEEGLLQEGPPRRQARRARAIRGYVRRMAARSPGAPLLLKNPAYTAQVPQLLRLFPGARVIHIRRDPRAVFASTRRSLRIVLSEMALQDWREVDIEAAVLRTYPQVMARLREGAEGLPEGAFTEVAFEDLVADPAATLEGLWHRLALPGGAEALGRARAYCESLSSFRPSDNPLTPSEEALLRRRWPRELADYGTLSAAAGE
ncbi:sulfotransferase family protein [Pseudoroseicyclus aestuarii]|uniref:Sulfotransferase family protein n=1 Tax=Pseudoroseicyclus aestuarii TaxID=1795041 RepID=A0A318SVT3_9RHOB|nr:sulfotransferase [Pseudoroseicyclus aestuarii]PYE85960.1 sulfotransferase family protein [Pseudoroseicyclus aestuarii]